MLKVSKPVGSFVHRLGDRAAPKVATPRRPVNGAPGELEVFCG